MYRLVCLYSINVAYICIYSVIILFFNKLFFLFLFLSIAPSVLEHFLIFENRSFQLTLLFLCQGSIIRHFTEKKKKNPGSFQWRMIIRSQHLSIGALSLTYWDLWVEGEKLHGRGIDY